MRLVTEHEGENGSVTASCEVVGRKREVGGHGRRPQTAPEPTVRGEPAQAGVLTPSVVQPTPSWQDPPLPSVISQPEAAGHRRSGTEIYREGAVMSQRKTAIAVGIPASNPWTSPPVVRPDSSARQAARIVGVLFLAGFLTYGVGNLMATGIVSSGDRSDSSALFVTGAALMLLNSAFVIGIGVLMFPILRAHNKTVAAGYLGTRIFEGVVLAIGVVSLIVLTGSAAIHANSVSYSVAEAGLGIGSLFFCSLLFRTGLVPRFLAVWGFIGYACFAGGNLLELFGVEGAGLVGTIPGGPFELTFGIWLIAKGFRSTSAAVPTRATGLVTAS